MQLLPGVLLCLLLVPRAMLGGQEKAPTSWPYNQVIMVPNGGSRGVWGPMEMCPKDTYANGFALKVAPYQGDALEEEDTGLNGIRLHCSDSTSLHSSVADWGRWLCTRHCPHGYLRAFSLHVRPRQHDGDDVAATSLSMACFNGELLAGDGGTRGQEGPWSDACLSGSICSLQTCMEGPHGEQEDNTAFSHVRFFCCPP